MKADESTAALTIRRYEERLAKDPGSLVFAPLADAHRKAGRPREAIRLCREGLERFPGYGTARLVLAKALLDDGEPDAALTEVKTLLSGNPGDAAGHRLAAELLRRAGRLEDAKHEMDEYTHYKGLKDKMGEVLKQVSGPTSPK